MQTFSMPGTKSKIKSAGKIAYCQHAASLFADINEPITIEEAKSARDANEW